MNSASLPIPLLASPFRLFFLLTGLYALVAVIGWVSFLFIGVPHTLGWSPLHWHSHEMLFGLTSAVIAGFILTAMCNWTSATPLQGYRLLALGLLWFAGRLAMWSASWLPVSWVALIDILFLPVLTLYVLRVLLRHNNKRNLILVGVLGLLSLANIAMHIGFVGRKVVWLELAEASAFNIIVLLMVIIGGRIIPAFTGNWLSNHGGNPYVVKTSMLIDRFTLIITSLLIPCSLIINTPILIGVVALLAALANAIRLWRWSGWRAGREPLLWILHLGYAWIVIALLCKGLSAFSLLAPSVWQHALGVGAMATLILGVMARVSLGHTGRTMILPKFGVAIFVAITLAAISRVFTALGWLPYSAGLMLTMMGWTLAFGLFIWLYLPILTLPRVDGRLG